MTSADVARRDSRVLADLDEGCEVRVGGHAEREAWGGRRRVVRGVEKPLEKASSSVFN